MSDFDHPLDPAEVEQRRRMAERFAGARDQLAVARGLEPHAQYALTADDISALDVAAQLLAAANRCGSYEGLAQLLRRAAGVINQQSLDHWEMDKTCRRDIGALFGQPHATAVEVRALVAHGMSNAFRLAGRDRIGPAERGLT